MKKVSAVAATQSKNFREQKLTIGLDLGDRSSWYCVLDASRPSGSAVGSFSIPMEGGGTCPFEKYREAWHLLREPGRVRLG